MNVRYADLGALECSVPRPMSLSALDREWPPFVTHGEGALRKLQKSLSLAREQQAPAS